MMGSGMRWILMSLHRTYGDLHDRLINGKLSSLHTTSTLFHGPPEVHALIHIILQLKSFECQCVSSSWADGIGWTCAHQCGFFLLSSLAPWWVADHNYHMNARKNLEKKTGSWGFQVGVVKSRFTVYQTWNHQIDSQRQRNWHVVLTICS